jgi:hypothetical protein
MDFISPTKRRGNICSSNYNDKRTNYRKCKIFKYKTEPYNGNISPPEDTSENIFFTVGHKALSRSFLTIFQIIFIEIYHDFELVYF